VSDTLEGAAESIALSSRRSVWRLSVVHSPDTSSIGKSVELGRNKMSFVGREAEGGFSVDDERVSKQHFLIAVVKDGLECADAGSTNGTFVDGMAQKSARLTHGSVIRAGDTLFVVCVGDEARRVNDSAARLAPTTFPMLLQGETGTGKEVLARFIHERSGRSGAFVPLNCAALSRELLAAELFGHAKGAFSGAAAARPGLFRAAEGGTLFLDEIGDLPLDLQPALLRALEERKVRPVGADHELPVDARVLAATHVDLERAVTEGTFRADLYARLAHVVLRLPPLRERRAELLELAARLAPSLRLSPDAAEALLLWHWPRNVRELRALLEVCSVLSTSGALRLRDVRERLPAAADRVRTRPPAPTPPASASIHPSVERRTQLLSLFKEHGGNVSKIAMELGKPRAQVYRWLKAVGLDAGELRSRKEQGL
jgi:transcriptional regulator with GAF, ATPase, and Fis domain